MTIRKTNKINIKCSDRKAVKTIEKYSTWRNGRMKKTFSTCNKANQRNCC